MLNESSLSLVLPCYNEAEGLARMWPRIPAEFDQVVVVDNNSSDDSGNVARELGAQVVEERRQGYGAAYKAGFRAATGDIVVAMDADGTYPVELAPKLAQRLLDERLDFISGCRFPLTDREAMSPINHAGNWGLTFAATLLFGRGVKDTQSGMWVFRRSILTRVKPTAEGMPFSQELKLRVVAEGYRFEEAHIPYGARVGSTKLSVIKDGVGNLAGLGTLWWELRNTPRASPQSSPSL